MFQFPVARPPYLYDNYQRDARATRDRRARRRSGRVARRGRALGRGTLNGALRKHFTSKILSIESGGHRPGPLGAVRDNVALGGVRLAVCPVCVIE